jgi:AcrR family transcriptional regulator
MNSVCFGPDVRRNVSAVLHELLPLDSKRAEEARIQLAFAARAATSPALADIQQAVLTELNDALTQTLVLAAAGRASAERCRLAAQVAVAAADGLALHAVSSNGWISASRLTAALELLLDALMPEKPVHVSAGVE